MLVYGSIYCVVESLYELDKNLKLFLSTVRLMQKSH